MHSIERDSGSPSGSSELAAAMDLAAASTCEDGAVSTREHAVLLATTAQRELATEAVLKRSRAMLVVMLVAMLVARR